MKTIENQKLPFFTSLLLTNHGMPDVMPKGPYAHINLSGTEDIPLVLLTQRQAEKVFTKLNGFEQTPEFIHTEKGYTEIENNLPKILLYDHASDSCIDGQCLIEEALATKKFMVGIRVTPQGDPNSPLIPFVRINYITDKQLIKDKESGTIIGFKLPSNKRNKNSKPKQYLFHQGDGVELFFDPKSIKRRMYVSPSTNNPEPKERKNIALGGGFTMQLKDIDPITNTVTALIEATSNDVVIREVHNPKNKDHYHSFTYTMHFDKKNGFLPLRDQSENKSTQDVIHQANLPVFLKHVVDTFVSSNSNALMNAFSAGINLKPNLPIHVIKCHYATIKDEHHKPKIITYAFNFESGESEEQWQAQNKRMSYPPLPTYNLFPIDNSRQQKQVFDKKATWQEPSPSQKLLLYQTYLMGFIPYNPHAALKFIKDNPELMSAEKTYRNYHQHINQDLQELAHHLPEAEVDQIKSHYQPDQGWTRQNSHYHTIGELLHTLLESKNTASLTKRVANQNLTDIQTYRIATGATTENLIKPLPKETHLASVDKKTLKHLIRQLENLLEFNEFQYIPIALIHSLREGD
jgi:hypothetical protein